MTLLQQTVQAYLEDKHPEWKVSQRFSDTIVIYKWLSDIEGRSIYIHMAANRHEASKNTISYIVSTPDPKWKRDKYTPCTLLEQITTAITELTIP